MTRRGWLRLMAAGVLVVWLCLFLHWDNTEKSMIRALLVETSGDGWTVGLLYQFPEASADSSEAKAAIRLCMGRGPELSSAISAIVSSPSFSSNVGSTLYLCFASELT